MTAIIENMMKLVLYETLIVGSNLIPFILLSCCLATQM